MRRALILVPLALFLVLVGFLAVGLTLKPTEVPSPLIGKPAPAFSVPQLHQPERAISATDLVGQVSVVNVWASWCAACRDEHPYVMALAQAGVAPVIGLNYKDDRDDALAWLDQFGDAYSVSAHDPEGRVGLDWGVYGVPETFVLDKRGVIRHKHIGPIDARALRDELLPLIAQLSEEQP